MIATIITVGGLGSSCMGTIEDAFRADPKCKVLSAGAWDGYKANLEGIIKANPSPVVAAIGHSFAGIPILKLIEKGLLQYAGLIDPVSCKWFCSSYPMPSVHPKFYWCRRSMPGIERMMDIPGAGEPEIVQGWHNGIPHSQEVVSRLQTDIADIIQAAS